MIDLRSDTVTRPSAAMRAAMVAAEVGDDDYREDPTVSELERRAAALLNKEAGLFLPSGVMSNLVAALTHCPADRHVVAMQNSHIAWSLTGNARVSCLVHLHAVPSDARGLPVSEALTSALDNSERSPVGLVCYENSHNQAGGTALRPEETAALVATAHHRGIPVHLDGARLFNAAVALGLPAAALAAEADSTTFCVSKGLGAPVGSVLCGGAAFIERAREYRKWLGGTMRQAGIVAAAGLFALDHQIERLAEDHTNARWLATQLAKLPGIEVAPAPVETNILLVRHERIDASSFYTALMARGVLTNKLGGRLRLVTHFDVDRDQLAQAVDVIRSVVCPD